MTEGGPICFIHSSSSLLSKTKPSMTYVWLEFWLSNDLKWANIFLKGSYYPSSGAINFSFTEAIYGSYSISLNPYSTVSNLATVVFPHPA